jgi:hypothetical protein
MCARLTSLLLATAWVAGVGCASKPPEEPSTAATIDRSCGSASANPLHLTSASGSQPNDHDPEIDSILTQPTSDRRLAQINRSMYQSLRTLDAELRREERAAACQPHPLDSPTLQAQANSQPGGDAGTANGTIGSSTISASLPASSNAAGASGTAISASSSTAATHAKSIRKASLSANGGGGNGATAPKVAPGNGNDIVARRLRKAAEQEANPALRAKLWKEYTDYRQGTSAN